MIIKYQALVASLKKRCAPVYIITGQEPYLFNQAVSQIKSAWTQFTHQDTEETSLTIQQATDWAIGLQDANSYALFTHYRFLDLRFEKKTLDAASKQHIQHYLEQPNPRCLVLIQAPMLPPKQLQALAGHTHIVHINVAALTAPALKQFIMDSLASHQLQYEAQVPELIFQYNQNNLLACSQIIEQMALIHKPSQSISCHTVMDYLRDQGDFSIYELGDACLAGETANAVHMLNQIQQSQGEPTLILWLLAQEIRKLIQLQHQLQQNVPFSAACQKLRIWAQKTMLYQKAVHRLKTPYLYNLLQACQHLDEQIKSNRNARLWQEIGKLILAITTGTTMEITLPSTRS